VCWIPIFKAKKLILAGDPMQLPPTILSLHGDKKLKNKNSLKPNTNSQSNDKRGVGESGSGIQADRSSASENASASDAERSAPEESQAVTDGIGSLSLKSTKEVRPTVLRPPRTLETTLFDRLEKMYGPSIKRMLNVQYRSVYSPSLDKLSMILM
jgi:DNA polymerase alpha-associated DNA helicase A